MRIDTWPHVLVVYDIPGDRARTKIADACLNYGLDRIQYSVFYGRLSRSHREDLMITAQKLLRDEPGNIQLVPISKKEWANRIVIEQGTDE